MEEEIDIIELLQRVKEGKAPRKIEVNGNEYCFEENVAYGDYCREDKHTRIYLSNEYDIRDLSKLKIKILDKPIIEELKISTDGKNPILIKKDGKTNHLRTIDVEIIDKINEIIHHLNKEEK